MKYFIVFFLCVFGSLSNAQKSIRFIAGLNYTQTNYYKIEFEKLVDTASYSQDLIVLPHFGFEYDIPIGNKFSFTTGLGLNMMGTSNYNSKIDYSLIDSITNQEVIQYLKANKHLKIMYLRVPFMIKYDIKNNLFVFVGYSLNYSIRKSQNILALNNPDSFPPEVGFIYRNYHHAALFGIRKDWKNISISANYHLGLSRIYDTTDFRADERAYLTLHGVQLSFGYKITE